MDKAQQTNDKLIWLWAAAGFLLPFLVFLLLKSSQLGGLIFFHNPLIHSLLLLTACGLAFYVVYVALRGYKESRAVNLFIIGLAFYTFGFVFFLHGITVPDIGLFAEALFDVTEHYGLFLGSFILLVLVLPLEGLKEFLYQHKVKIFLVWAAFLLTAFIGLVLFPPLAEILEKVMDLFIGLTIPLVVITLIFMIVLYQRNRSNLLFYFIIGLAILVNSAIIPFFYQEWNFLWWYFHFTFLLAFLVILLGLLRYRHEKEEIIKALVKTPFYKTLGSKLLVVFLLVALLPLGIFGYLSIQNSKANLEKEIASKMLLLAEAKEGQVYTYLDSLEKRTLDFSSDSFIKESLKQIVNIDSKITAEALNEYLIKNKQSLDPSLAGILIIDLGGKVVASTDEEEIGDDEEDDEYFIQGQKGIFTIELRGEEHFGLINPFMVSAPLINKDSGQLLGVIVNVFDTKILHDILSGEFQIEKGAISEREGLGKTLDVYLVNKEKIMFVHPHRLGETEEHEGHFAQMTVDSLPVGKCLEKGEEFSGVYLNYAGKEVVGSSMCFKKQGWVLLSEITTEEAFAPIREARILLGSIAGLLTVLVGVFALLFSGQVTGPIKKLHEGAEVIAQGNLDYQVEIKSGDEIEQLARAFNEMTAKLKGNYGKLAEEHARLEASINSLNLGFIITDTKADIIMINGIAKYIICVRGEESEQMGVIKKSINLDFKCTINDIENNLKSAFDIKKKINECVKNKKPLEFKDVAFKNHYLHIYLFPILMTEKMEVIGCAVLIEDITEEKILQRSRDEFFSIASHELRTPLTAIKGNTSMLLDYFGDQLKDPQIKEMVDDVHRSSIRLIEIVNDFLDASRLELGKMEFKKDILDLPQLIPGVIKEYQVSSSRKKLYIHFEDIGKVPPVVGDKDRFKQVLINLIGNCLKFTREGGVTISLKTEGNFVKVLVTDTGMGIPEDNQKFLFRKFQQAESNILTRDVTKGTGLGLYISRMLTEGMGGKITLESSEVGKGSTFSITLPVATQADIAAAKVAAAKIQADFHTGPAMNTDKSNVDTGRVKK